MSLVEQLDILKNYINKRYGYGEYGIRKLAESGSFNYTMSLFNIDDNLRIEVSNFLDYLFNVPDDRKYAKQIELYEYNDFIYCNFNCFYSFLFSYYFNQNFEEKNIVSFLLNCIKKFNLVQYSGLTYSKLESVLAKYFTIDKIRLDNGSINEVIVPRLKKTNRPPFKYYEDKALSLDFDFSDKDLLSRCAEYYAYNKEFYDVYQFLKDGTNRFVKWVAFCYGDGYGYDVLSYDPATGKEKIIEVKARNKSSYLALSKNEYKTMLSTKDNPNADYYVYEYCFDEKTRSAFLTIYKYDKVNDVMIDNNGTEYKISPYVYPIGEMDKKASFDSSFEDILFFIEDSIKYNQKIKRFYKNYYVYEN